MDPEIQELLKLLEAAESILAQYGENHWSKWLQNDSHLIKNLDFYGIEDLLTAFSGMGSINDLLIHPINGHKIQESEVDTVNEKIKFLLSNIYSLAETLAREEANARHSP